MVNTELYMYVHFQVAEMYKSQQQIQNQNKDDKDEEDFY